MQQLNMNCAIAASSSEGTETARTHGHRYCRARGGPRRSTSGKTPPTSAHVPTIASSTYFSVSVLPGRARAWACESGGARVRACEAGGAVPRRIGPLVTLVAQSQRRLERKQQPARVGGVVVDEQRAEQDEKVEDARPAEPLGLARAERHVEEGGVDAEALRVAPEPQHEGE
eukprot:7388501-Prymnesium_polylepis.1